MVRVTLDGTSLDVPPGRSIAAALLAVGVRALRRSPRAGTPRGAFCHMGVCQECLIWADGRDGAGLPRAGRRWHGTAAPGVTEPFDIAVLGGGPAGMAAPTEAARGGARTVLVDENAAPGGQVYRQPLPGLTLGGDGATGEQLRAALRVSGAALRLGERVWGVGGGALVASGAPAAGGPFRLDLVGPAAASSVVVRALILCPGTTERVVPFPVIGLAGTTVLLKAQGVLPGRRVVVAGRGPLLAAVAAGVLHLGGRVVAVVDAAPRAAWLGAMAALASRPALLARSAGWLAAIAAARVPVLSGWRVAAAEGETEIGAVDIAPVNAAADSGTLRRLACDALCVGDGLVPGDRGGHGSGRAAPVRSCTRRLGAAPRSGPAHRHRRPLCRGRRRGRARSGRGAVDWTARRPLGPAGSWPAAPGHGSARRRAAAEGRWRQPLRRGDGRDVGGAGATAMRARISF